MEKLKPGYEILPGWEVIRSLGKGAYGYVYEVRKKGSADTQTTSAVKVISLPQSAEDYEPFRDEGYDDAALAEMYRGHVEKMSSEFKLMAEIKGMTNIVSYEDHEVRQQEDGIGWDVLIRMEMLTSLTELLKRQTITDELVCRVGIDICKALEICGKMNIIHRDIKPQNVFVNKFGDFKLGDFGISRTMSRSTRATMAGTPDYMAPEVYRNSPYDARADQYSLGIMMYWMLNARRLPFLPLPPAIESVSQRDEALERRLRGDPFPRPVNGSDALVAVVLKACSFDPDDRFPDPTAMMKALVLAKQGISMELPEPVPEPPPVPVISAPPPAKKKKGGGKIWFGVLLTLALLAGSAFGITKLMRSLKPAEETGTGSLRFQSNGNGTCVVSGYADSGSASEKIAVTIPARSPDDEIVTGIGPVAFMGTALTRITIPATVSEIGNDAFNGCKNLKKITLPENLKTVGENAFRGCTSLSEAVLPDALTSLGAGAFEGCTALTGITIPSGLTEIWDYVFSRTGLKELYLPANVSALSAYAFIECPDLESIEVAPASPICVGIGNCLIARAEKTLLLGCKNSVIPDDGSVTMIGDYAFSCCTGLTEIEIPGTVKKIGYYAFSNSGLCSVTLNEGLNSIEAGAFAGTKLTALSLPGTITGFLSGSSFPETLVTLTLSPELKGYRVTDGNCLVSGDRLIRAFDSSVLPDDGTVKILGSDAFTALGIASAVIPEGVTEIESICFYCPPELERVTLPASLETIRSAAFYECPKLSEINYAGTVSQWNAVIKESNWASECPAFTVHCLDGNVNVG